MREEHKLNKAIQQDGVDTQSDILEDLKRRYPQYVEQSDNKRAPARKRKTAFIVAFASVAACAAIVVPCAVLLPNNSGNNGGDEGTRYCTINEYRKEAVAYTIGEYRESNNLNFLYFNWYEEGEDCSTVCYLSNSDDEVLGLEEKIYLPQLDEFVQLSITKSNVYLSAFDSTIEYCDMEQGINNHSVKWFVNIAEAICIFEDGGYRYFIQIEQEKDENKLFELVTELLETK